MGFVHAHFRYTAKTFTARTLMKGSFQCLTVSVGVFLATAMAKDGATGVIKQPTRISKMSQITNLKKGILYSILQDESHTFLSTIQILIGINFYNFQRTRTCRPVEQTNVGCTTSPTNQMNS